MASSVDLWISRKALAGIQKFYEHSGACVKVARNVGSYFNVSKSLKQTFGIFLWLCIFYMDVVVRKACESTQGKGVKLTAWNQRGWLLSQNSFANTMALMTESAEQLQSLVIKLKKMCKKESGE